MACFWWFWILRDIIPNVLDNECELLAKKLIFAWLHDPSLALVLRKALEMFPSPTIAEPIFEALYKRMHNTEKMDKNAEITSAQVNYILADLFRFCIDFSGRYMQGGNPQSSNPEALLELAARYAQKVQNHQYAPDYAVRQALLLMAIMKKPIIFRETHGALELHKVLHNILSGFPAHFERKHLGLYEVVSQAYNNVDYVASLLVDHIREKNSFFAKEVLEDFTNLGGEFVQRVMSRMKLRNISVELVNEFSWAMPELRRNLGSSSTQLLIRIINSNQNGFVHESALLKLAIALIDGIQDGKLEVGLSPRQILIKKKTKHSWNEIWKSEAKFVAEPYRDGHRDPRYDVPKWIDSSSKDCVCMYWIGMVLRSAVVGAEDYTLMRGSKNERIGYIGLHTSWYKRRMGMMHSPENLVGDYATVSDWATELLKICLQWPGFEATHLKHIEISKIEDLQSLSEVVIERQDYLKRKICEASNMPGLVTDVKRPRGNGRQEFRLVAVQQLLPRDSNFTKFDPQLNAPSIKGNNRSHLASMCSLVYKTLETQVHAEGGSESPLADLIIFPELAAHQDDLDLLKTLADTTKSIILAGIVFKEDDSDLVNVARWLIPDYRDSGRQWRIRDQGKGYITDKEKSLKIKPKRPCQHILKIEDFLEGPFKISAAICYDATDLKLVSDMKFKSDIFVIVAHNKDVTTFDNMASALHYHMYQHIVLVNKGEFGGSTIQAPYKQPYNRLISHAHGKEQISISIADLDLAAFKRKQRKKYKKIKTKPAG